MTRIALPVALLLCVACSRQEPLPPPEPAPASSVSQPDAAPERTAGVSAGTATPADPAVAFDTGAFSGTFAGGGQRLELHADGSYGLEAPEGISQGTWTHEAATNSIRLDPGSKTAEDRVFRMGDADTLTDGVATLSRQPMP